MGDGAASINVNMTIHDNYDTFKAYITILGNKQYLWKMFGYKNKEYVVNFNQTISDTVGKHKESCNKTNIDVSKELVTATKRQKRAPAGKPADA